MNNEQWKEIKGYEGIYQVSDTFKIRKISGYKSGIMKSQKDHDGYFHIGLTKNKVRSNFLVHRLMMIAFISDPPLPNSEILHIDGNNQNNVLSNYRWGTHKENMEDKIKHGVNNGTDKHGGSGNPAAKLKESDIAIIKEMYASGGISQNKIGIIYGVSQSCIYTVVNNKKWKAV